MRKKVCFVVTDAVSFNVLCRGQLEYLKDNLDADIWLLCGGSRSEVQELKGRAVGNVVRIPLVRNPSVAYDLLSLFRLVSFFSRNRFDLVVYSTPKATLLCSLAAFVTRQRKRVALVRGRVYENYSGVKRAIYSGFDRVVFSLSNRVIFISKSLKEVCEAEGLLPTSKGMVLGFGSSNGVDVDRFKPGSSLKDEFLHVVSVGRVCIDKGVEDLLKVVEHVSNVTSLVKFNVVGNVEDERSKLILEELIKFDCVSYSKHGKNVEKVFKNADVHLFLSRREGFGNVAIEAAASGVPTFSYDVVGVKDSVENQVSGLRFNYQSTAAISNELIQASFDVSLFRKSYPYAREWAVERFSQQAVWERYKEIYSDIIKL